MKDFFNQFRENLASQPEPEFDPQDWQRLEKRLDELPVKHRRPFPIFGWLILPLGLLLLGSNAAFWFKIRRAHQTIEWLENRRDTVFLTKIVHRVDTVLLPCLSHQTVAGPLPAVFREGEKWKLGNSFLVASPGVFVEKNAPDSKVSRFAEKPLVVDNQSSIPYSSTEPLIARKIPEEFFLTQSDTVFEKVPAPGISELQAGNLPLADSSARKTALERRRGNQKSSGEHWLALRPKNFSLFVTSGLAMPPLAGRHVKPGWSAGLAGEVGFSKNLRLRADFHFQQNYLETSHMDATLGVPPVAPPDDNLKFVQATAPEKFWQFSAGMAYVFPSLSGWRPMLGAGWGIRLAQAYDLTYEFENEVLDISWKFESEVVPIEKKMQFASVWCGVEREFSRQWRMQISGSLRGDFTSEGLRKPRFSVFQLGLGRRF